MVVAASVLRHPGDEGALASVHSHSLIFLMTGGLSRWIRCPGSLVVSGMQFDTTAPGLALVVLLTAYIDVGAEVDEAAFISMYVFQADVKNSLCGFSSTAETAQTLATLPRSMGAFSV